MRLGIVEVSICVLLASATHAGAAAIPAASCSASHVQAALNQASAGDTVHIPAGTCTWTSQVSWSAPPNVTVLGAGSLSTVGGGDNTIIVDNYTGSPTFLLNISTSTTGTFRLAGLTFRQGTGVVKESAVLTIGGGSQLVRIDHSHFDFPGGGSNSKLIRFVGALAGTVDSNIFDVGAQGNYVFFQGSGNGDAAWAQPTGAGSAGYVFIENNDWRSRSRFGGMTDCNTGAKFVVRYNRIQSAGVGQTHPTGGQGRGRGCRAHEIYGNTVTSASWYSASSSEPPFAFSYMTSGTLLVWGNSYGSQLFKNFLYLNSTRKDNGTYGQSATPNGWGYCGTQFNGTGSNWDGNTNASSGYPCLDNPGRGQGDLISGDFPNARNQATGSIAWPNQALEPVYEWLNTGSVHSGWGGSAYSNQASTRLAQNRDYYLATNSFNGTSGVGVGPRGSRPNVCTQGVAYWSTDQGGNWHTANSSSNDGTLDVCTGTNVWTNSVYTPYSYPHPLTQGLPAQELPAAPTGLRVVTP